MKLSMPFKDYLRILKAYSNAPLTLNRLTLPFGIVAGADASSTLLVGHVLDDLAGRLRGDEPVDCIDVVAVAYDLGHEQAGPFLDQAPDIMAKMARKLGPSPMH